MKYMILIGSAIILIFTVLVLLLVPVDESFSRTIHIQPENITKIVFNIPGNDTYKTITEQREIRHLIHYFENVRYEHVPDDKVSYIPMRLGIIYIFENDNKSAFLIPYGKEIMIDRKIYTV